MFADIRPEAGDALVVIDPQIDFCPGGALAVPDGDAVMGPINALAQGFEHVILTQDWHPAGHISFATSQAGAATRADLILRKGCNPSIDSYSAFFEIDRRTATGLGGYLRERGLIRCVFVGLALDFCVRFSAEDAIAQGFAAAVIVAATRALDLNGSREDALSSLAGLGVTLI